MSKETFSNLSPSFLMMEFSFPPARSILISSSSASYSAIKLSSSQAVIFPFASSICVCDPRILTEPVSLSTSNFTLSSSVSWERISFPDTPRKVPRRFVPTSIEPTKLFFRISLIIASALRRGGVESVSASVSVLASASVSTFIPTKS